MKCTVYYYQLMEKMPKKSEDLPPSSYFLRVYTGSLEYLIATFFHTDEKSNIEDLAEYTIPNVMGDAKERFIYWANLVDRLKERGVTEVKILDTCNKCTIEISNIFAAFGMEVVK